MSRGEAAKRRAEELGRKAEEAVARAYLAEGAALRAARWKTPHGEIDLILETAQGAIVFVEVKARKTLHEALQALGPRQMRRLSHAALLYIAAHPELTAREMRLDLAAVDELGRIERIPNIEALE